MQLNLRTLLESKQQLLILIAAFILFILAIIFGVTSGRSSARARADYENVMTLKQALDYFHTDQDRYPSAEQFYNQKILVPLYLNIMPTVAGTSGVCEGFTDYVYTQTAPNNYSLKFCLIKSVEGLDAGPHELSDSGLR